MEGHRSKALLYLGSLITKGIEDIKNTDPDMRAIYKIFEERTTVSAGISKCLQIYTDHPDEVRSIKYRSPATGTEVTMTKAEEFQRSMEEFTGYLGRLSEELKYDREYLSNCVYQLSGLVELVQHAKTEEELSNIKYNDQYLNCADVMACRCRIEEWEKMDLIRKVDEHLKELELATGKKILSKLD